MGERACIDISTAMERNRIKASTLPELLVAMVIGGILLLTIFDGVDIIRRIIGAGAQPNFGESLQHLQEREIYEERSDSVVHHDSLLLFYRNGEVIKTMERDDRNE